MNLQNLDTLIAFAVVMLLLSLIITTVVQLVSAAWRLREKVLFWGVARILAVHAPKANADDLAALAGRVVNHPSLKPVARRSATAITFDELVKILGELLADDPQKQKYQALLDTLKAAPSTEVGQLASSLEEQLIKALPKEAELLKNAVEQAKQKTLEAGAKLRFWFDTVMARTTERFTVYTRWFTVVAALLLAFGARIDSIDMVKQLSDQHDVRDRLVQMADPLLKQAPAMLGPAPASPTRNDAPLPATLEAVKARHPEIPANFVPPDSTERVEWENALVAVLPPETGEGVLAGFRTELAKREIQQLSSQLKTLKGDLDRSGLRIIPANPYEKGYFRHFPGMLLTALLLSLGAPFWFNALRQLSNLRPIIAGKVDAKEKQDAGT